MRHPRQPRRGSLTLPGGWSMVGQRPLAFNPLALPGLRAYYLANQGATAWDVANFDGSTQYFSGDGSWLNGLTKLTLAGFFYSNNVPTAAGCLAAQADGASQNCFELSVIGNSLLVYVAPNLSTMDNSHRVVGSQYVGAITGQGSAAYHVCVVYDGTQSANAARVKLYVNGVLDTGATYGTIATSLTSASSAFTLGQAGPEVGTKFQGQLWDWVAYAGVALTDAQVATLANVGAASSNPLYYGAALPTLPGGNPSPSHWWRLGESSNGTGAVSRADSIGSVTLTDHGNTPSFGLAGWRDLSTAGSHALSVVKDSHQAVPPVLATDTDGSTYWDLDGTDTGSGTHTCNFRCGKLGLSATPAAWTVFFVLHVYADSLLTNQFQYAAAEKDGGLDGNNASPQTWGFLENNDFEFRSGSLTTAGGGVTAGSVPAVNACNSGYHELPAAGRYLVVIQQVPGEPGQRLRVNGSEWAMRSQGTCPSFWATLGVFVPLASAGGQAVTNWRLGQDGDWDFAPGLIHARYFALAACAPDYPSTSGPTDAQVATMEVYLANLYGVTLNASNLLRPAVTSISPTTTTTGQTLTVNGSGFTGATGVRFGAAFQHLQSTVTVVSDSQITCTIPSSASTGQVAVVTPGGEVSGPDVLTLPIVLSGFSPSSGATGDSITLSSDNFLGVTAVSFNGTAATLQSPLGGADTGHITVPVPPNATTGPISVTNAAGTTTTGSNFTCTGPSITSLSVSSGKVGDTVVITGVQFTAASSVTFNGTSASYSVDSSTQITATVPSGATTGPIVVTTANGTGTYPFTVQVPQVTSFTPTSGGVGTSVSLTGTFLSGVTSMTLNGVSVSSFTVNSSTSITATVPTTTSGEWGLTDPALGTGTSAGATPPYFTVTGVAPTITSMTPTFGWSGSSVVIAGTGFTGASAVTFYNGQAATSYTVDSELQITATVPSGITTGVLSITNGTGTGSSATNFENAYAYDSFTDTNGTALASHTMNHGAGWTVPHGSCSIQGNVAVGGTGGTDNEAVVDVGQTDYTVEAVGHSSTSTSRLAVFVRFGANDGNSWCVYFQTAGTTELEVYKNFATLKATAALTYVADKDWHFKVTVSGTSLTATVYQADNPSNTANVSFTMDSGATNTKCGVDTYSNVSGSGWKSFLVYQ